MYKTSGQLKQEAKDSLRGRWKDAVILNLIPSLLQIVTMFLISLAIAGIVFFVSVFTATSTFESFDSGKGIESTQVEQLFDGDAEEWFSEFESDEDYYASNSSALGAMASASSSSFMAPIIGIVLTLLTVGISFTFLDVVRKREEQPIEFKDAFRVFNGVDFVPVFLISILTYVFKYFWGLLLVIPGIIKRYSYSQSYFIYKDLATHRDVRTMGATSFITESRTLMRGHKARLFWLEVSFIGWYILGYMTIIGILWVNPYVQTTKAAFYDDLSKGKFLAPEEVEEEDEWTSF